MTAVIASYRGCRDNRPIFLAAYFSTPGSLADPPGSSVLVASVAWLQATLLRTIATTIAIIAIASVGVMMRAGRVNIRHGLTVVMGSFILFGASAIVAGIQSSLAGGGRATRIVTAETPAPMVAAPSSPPPPASNDPYAGASVPTR